MEKALEILKDLLVKTRLDEEIVSEHIVFDIKGAIIELEEAIKPKTCEGCKHDEELYCLTDMKKECYMCSRNVQDLYQPKEQ